MLLCHCTVDKNTFLLDLRGVDSIMLLRSSSTPALNSLIGIQVESELSSSRRFVQFTNLGMAMVGPGFIMIDSPNSKGRCLKMIYITPYLIRLQVGWD